MILGSNGHRLQPSRPEPRITVGFEMPVNPGDVAHIRRELKRCALVCGVKLTIKDEPEWREGDDASSTPRRLLTCGAFGRERDVQRYMDAVKKWSAAGK